MQNDNIKDAFKKIASKEGLTLQDILNKYNYYYKKNVTKQSYNAMLTNKTIKISMLYNLLDCIGYKIEFKKKL